MPESGHVLIFSAEYWINLGQNVAFRGRKLIECIRRIHEDILKVWNFNDPDKVISMSHRFGCIVTYHISSCCLVTISSRKQSNLLRNLFPRMIRESVLLYLLMAPERPIPARTGYQDARMQSLLRPLSGRLLHMYWEASVSASSRSSSCFRYTKPCKIGRAHV